VRFLDVIIVDNSIIVGIVHWANETLLGTVVEAVVTIADDPVVDLLAILASDVAFLVTDASFHGTELFWFTVLLIHPCGTHGWEAAFLTALHGADPWFVILTTSLAAVGCIVQVAVLLGPKFRLGTIAIVFFSTNVWSHIHPRRTIIPVCVRSSSPGCVHSIHSRISGFGDSSFEKSPFLSLKHPLSLRDSSCARRND
jgi:hypothetical protein